MPVSDTTFIARSKGASILGGFGAAWFVAWLLQTHRVSPMKVTMIILGGCIIIGAAILQLRRYRRLTSSSLANRTSLRAYGIISAVQWLLILTVAAMLPAIGLPEWFAPASILIVGLHFFPLARIFGDWLYSVTGLSLVLLALLYPFLAGPNSPVGLFGAGAILWASAIIGLAANNSFKPNPIHGSA